MWAANVHILKTYIFGFHALYGAGGGVDPMAESLRDQIVHPAEGVYAWVEQGSSIHLKAVTTAGDPVELSADEARAVADALLRLAACLEASEA
jgi:hypothetical protein